MDIKILLEQMVVLFAMIMVGCFVYKKKWLTEEASSCFSKIVVNIFNPLLIISGVLGETGEIGLDQTIENLELVALYFIISFVSAFGVVALLHPPKNLKSIYLLLSSFSNLGFMGIPIARSLYGDEGVVYISFYIAIYNVFVYTYAIALAKRAAFEKNGTKPPKTPFRETVRRMVNPGLIAALAAIAILAFGIKVPEPVASFCSTMGDATIPLAMIMIGLSVGKADLKSYVKDWRMYGFIIVRMLALPIAVGWLMRGLGFGQAVFGVFILELAMPAGSIIGLFAQESGADHEYCMKGTVFTTLASIVTIPIVMLFVD